MLHTSDNFASVKSKNLNIRLDPKDLKTFLTAAKVDRRTLSSFVIHACYRYATEVVTNPVSHMKFKPNSGSN